MGLRGAQSHIDRYSRHEARGRIRDVNECLGDAKEACGSEQDAETPAEETVAVTGEERVVWVSGQMLHLPRLPFFGCEDVTDDDLRAIIEEVVQNPESDE